MIEHYVSNAVVTTQETLLCYGFLGITGLTSWREIGRIVGATERQGDDVVNDGGGCQALLMVAISAKRL